MITVALALLPDLALVVLGACIVRYVAEPIWAGLDRLNYLVLFPALLFSAAAARPILPEQVATVGISVWAIMLAGLLIALPLRSLGPERFLDFAGVWQTAWRFNAAIAFVAIQALPAEAAALMPLTIGFAVPLANVLAVAALSHGQSMGVRASISSILMNPFLLASGTGVALGLTDLAPPEVPMRSLERLGDAAVPLALLSIGASIQIRSIIRLDGFSVGLNATKLVVLPTIVLLVGRSIDMNASMNALLVIFAALPSAAAAPVLARAFGADYKLTSNIVAQSTLLACITLPIWIKIIVV